MKHLAAYLLLIQGGNANPSAEDIKKVLSSVGIEAEQARLDALLKDIQGKSIDELIAEGQPKLASISAGGAAPAGGAAAPAAGGAAEEAKAEEKKEEAKEESDDGICGSQVERDEEVAIDRTLKSKESPGLAHNLDRSPGSALSQQEDLEHGYHSGRVYHAEHISAYLLPNDLEEADRMQEQHWIIKEFHRGNYKAPVHQLLLDGAKVLDVGCGPGTWILDMAHDYPEATFYGIDISPTFPRDIRPRNTHFQIADILKGLPFPDNSFDYIFQRFLGLGYTPVTWKIAMKELRRVIKPGGYVELIEATFDGANAGPIYSALLEGLIATMNERNIDPTAPVHISNMLALVTDNPGTITAGKFAIKVGWGDVVGELTGRDLIRTLAGLEGGIIKHRNITPEQYAEELKQLPAEFKKHETLIYEYYAYTRISKDVLNLKTFPFISLTSPPFLASCVLVLLNHYLWFTYFSSHYEPFMDIASFFGIMVWLVPFAYFISLSANDAVLPTSDVTNPTPVQGHQALLKTILEYLPRIGTKKRDNNGVFPASSSQESFQRPPMGFAPPNETPLYTQEAEVPDYAFQPYQSQKSSQSTPSPAHSMAPPYDPRDQSARNGTAETAYAGKITPGLGNISNSSTTRVHAGRRRKYVN
ncbi:hypothetical protein BZG36_01146 [Bifiguratus adelaidae]|uniref:Methyltransferase domain-containing protein n=1 Tax=Bifiguratus adelaidae TaxID=1938954 RepID=A0A261Y6D0_9FUNG|nr:hypothetical protein BZG36_01146 [Bifiguratus adelaidae]